MSYLEEESKKSSQSDKVKVNMNLNISQEIIDVLEKLKIEWGVRSRARAVEILLEEIFLGDQSTKQNDD